MTTFATQRVNTKMECETGIAGGWWYTFQCSGEVFDPIKPLPNDNALGPFKTEKEAVKDAVLGLIVDNEELAIVVKRSF